MELQSEAAGRQSRPVRGTTRLQPQDGGAGVGALVFSFRCVGVLSEWYDAVVLHVYTLQEGTPAAVQRTKQISAWVIEPVITQVRPAVALCLRE